MTKNDYFLAMIFIAPALCSTVCALLVALLLHDNRNSRDGLMRIAAIALSFIFSALWITPLITGWSPPESATWAWRAITATSIALPLLQVWFTWRIVRRGRSDGEKMPLIPTVKKNTPQTAEIEHSEAEQLTKKRLEEYFKMRRPYLNPEFKLADLADAMEVNRSEMSAFVNRTFEIGFKRYVNRWRLAEYNRLMALPSNELKNPYRVVKMAGFTDTRHYHRVVELEKTHENSQENAL